MLTRTDRSFPRPRDASAGLDTVSDFDDHNDAEDNRGDFSTASF